MDAITWTPEERGMLRELGRRKFEIGNLDVQAQTAAKWRDLNSLRHTRPLVWINEIPWREMAPKAPELIARCRDPFLAGVEGALRRELYQWDHFACDMVVEPVLFCDLVGGPRGVYADYGIQEKKISREGGQDVLFEPVILTLEDAMRIQTPRVWCDREATQERFEALSAIFENVIPIQERGIVHQWHTPWDQAIHWYGVTKLMMDMYDNPELVALVAERMCKAAGEVLDRQQELGMLDVGSGNWRVGSGGLGHCDALPTSVSGRPVTPRDQWGCGNAQIFSEVSPDMHEEFSLRFERPFLERFGLTYYGCCEPLHNKIEMLRSVRNLRKISMSPKADMGVVAETGGKDFVLSFKPNPAYMAPDTFRPEQVEDDLRRTLAKARGCCVEVILKDITTIRADLPRLDSWAATAMRVVQEFEA